MARSRKRMTTGETTRIFRPKKLSKIKNRRIWPFLIIGILVIISSYYIWNEYLNSPDLSMEYLKNKLSVSTDDKSKLKSDTLKVIEKVIQEDTKTDEAENTVVQKKEKKATEKKKPLSNIPAPIQRNIQVEVLNGCGVRGLASSFAKSLRKKGIDVVKTGNYKSSQVKSTQVIDRIGNKEFARQIGEILGINSRHIYTQKKTELLIDATIILGKDYKQLKR